MIWPALLLTLRLALIVTAALLVIGLPIAYWITYSRWRWKFLVEAVVALPLVLPPTVLGFYLLLAMGSRSPVGRWWIAHTGHPLAFSFEGLVIGSILYSMPFAVQPFAASFASVSRELLAASATLGAGRLKTVVRVILPLSLTGIITGIALTFAHTVGEFGVVLMIGGNIPGVTRVVSVQIYDHVEALEYAEAHWLAGSMVIFSFLVLLALYMIYLPVSKAGDPNEPAPPTAIM